MPKHNNVGCSLATKITAQLDLSNFDYISKYRLTT